MWFYWGFVGFITSIKIPTLIESGFATADGIVEGVVADVAEELEPLNGLLLVPCSAAPFSLAECLVAVAGSFRALLLTSTG